MDKYEVLLSPKALRDLDAIYGYLAELVSEEQTVLDWIEALEAGILSLAELPYRCPERRVGVYANRGYRQLFIRNYTVITGSTKLPGRSLCSRLSIPEVICNTELQ